MNIAATLVQALKLKGAIVALAESCTGGGIASAITAIEGSSACFDRGFVTYSNAAKMQMLGVSEETLAAYGAVSGQTAEAMALGALEHSLADISLSVTGIAGPGGATADKPVGTVWFGLAKRDHVVQSHLECLKGGRNQVRAAAVDFALRWILSVL
jgi:nicotinamide-nucleotide amidase